MNISTNFPNQPKFHNNNTYVNDYIELVNDYYSQWSLTGIKVTYYNLDIENSTIDKEKLDGGSYEIVGDKSGWRWRKILNFELNGVSAVSNTPTNDEKGTTNSDKLTEAYFPRTNGIVPKVHDFVSFDMFNKDNHFVLRDSPLYEVVNIERSNDFELCFYKVSLKISYVLKSQIDMQLYDILDFINYEKHLYSIDSSIVLTKILEQKGENKLKGLFDQKSGLYCETSTL